MAVLGPLKQSEAKSGEDVAALGPLEQSETNSKEQSLTCFMSRVLAYLGYML